MYPAGPEPFWFRAGGAWALGVGFDLTSQRPKCFRMALMTSRSSMKLMIRMIPRYCGQAPLNSEGLFRPPIKHFLLNHGQVTLSGRYYSSGQVRGSTFPDQVGDRLRSSGLAGPSFSGIGGRRRRGSRGRPSCRSSKWRCGPVDFPVLPTPPMAYPWRTASPSWAMITFRWP